MHRILRTLTILFALAVALPVLAQNAPFRFEDYEEKTGFIEAVTARFPVGSSYLEFKKQIIKAGANAQQNILDEPKNQHLFLKNERPGVATMVLTNWSIAVSVQGDTIIAISPTLKTTGSYPAI